MITNEQTKRLQEQAKKQLEEGKKNLAKRNLHNNMDFLPDSYPYNNKCCLCGKPFTFSNEGNNAEPLAEGLCCDKCNDKVIEARLSQLF